MFSNHKQPRRKGKVQLIDATDLYQKMRKSLGQKRHELAEKHIREIVDLYTEFTDSRGDRLVARSKAFAREEFGYRKIRIERPLRRNYAATPEFIELLQEKRTALISHAVTRGLDPDAPLEEQRAINQQVNHRTAKIDGLIETVREHNDVLQEYRMALTSAAVTGTIDVRGET